MDKLSKYAKAAAAFLVSGYTLYQAAKGETTVAGAGVTFDEWVGIVSSALVVAFGVWAVPNGPAKPTQ